MSEQATVFRARKVYRSDGSLLDDGAVVCRDGRIASVARWTEVRGEVGGSSDVVDLGDVLLLPGLVNAHTHLRLTHLKGKLAPGKDFVGWLGNIAVRSKMTRTSTLRRAIEAGARELLEGGVTTAVEIDDMEGLSAATLGDSPLRLIFAHECISMNPNKAEQIASDLVALVERSGGERYRREHGVAPHAPYSVGRELWESLAKKLAERPAFSTIHMAESTDEVEMFAEGRGKMVMWLKLFGVLPRDWAPPRCSPVEYLERTGILATPGIAAHCGCADDADAERLARHGWTVACCPGTHEFFQRPPYPLERFRRAGVPVCVATDSVASNTGLSMMEEMRRLARDFPDLAAPEIVAAATSIPARAVGWGDAIGRIAPGFLADFSVWSPACAGDRLDRDWFESEPPTCTATIIAGARVLP